MCATTLTRHGRTWRSGALHPSGGGPPQRIRFRTGQPGSQCVSSARGRNSRPPGDGAPRLIARAPAYVQFESDGPDAVQHAPDAGTGFAAALRILPDHIADHGSLHDRAALSLDQDPATLDSLPTDERLSSHR